jgi:hypothetical protein
MKLTSKNERFSAFPFQRSPIENILGTLCAHAHKIPGSHDQGTLRELWELWEPRQWGLYVD